jgi:hypothetical protein
MKPSMMLAVVGCAVVLSAAPPSAFAQRGGGGGHGGFGGGHMGGGGFGGGHMGGGGQMGRAPVVRGGGWGRPIMTPGGAGRPVPIGPVMGPRGFGSVHGAVGTSGVLRGGTFTNGRAFVHGGTFVQHGGTFVQHGGTFVQHGGTFVQHGGTFVHGSFGHGFHAAPVHFFHPYYAFRPHFSLGFGIWTGYPFAYPYAYYDPFYPYYYPNGYLSSYSYPTSDYAYPPTNTEPVESGSLGVQPGQTNMGGMSFDITPTTAQLFIDGTLVGTVGEFTPTTQPLGLLTGRHRVEVRASGYQTMSFDVDIVAGQVIPYQGTLERQ